MGNFEHEQYKRLVNDLINDIFYNENGSERGKIATIRQYAEVIVRKILNLSHTQYVTLGKKDIVNSLKKVSNNNPLLMESIKNIKLFGNNATHTRYINEISQADLEKCKTSLLNLYAYLYIEYFEEFEFGKNKEILSSFSILPPIIRYIVLEYLYKKYPNNLDVIDKLSLVILKQFGKDKAETWINDNSEALKTLSCISKNGEEALIKQYGVSLANEIIKKAPENMYTLCLDKINDVEQVIKTNGLLYNNFEQAITLYKEKGYVDGDSIEIDKFNLIMQFVYLGRKSIQNNRLQDLDKYIIMGQQT